MSPSAPAGAPAARPLSTRSVVLGALAWLVLAIGASQAGLLRLAGPPWPQLVLVGLTLALAVLTVAWPALRAWTLAVDPRALVAIHVSRFVGFHFLALHARGELPWAFAVPGGWGDIAVAALALVVVATAPRHGRAGRQAYGAFTLVGLADILLVVATAARLALADPGSMVALTRLPLALLPAFLVPVIVWSHLVVLARVVRAGGAAGRV